MSLPVALDAMGGDHGAVPNVEGRCRPPARACP